MDVLGCVPLQLVNRDDWAAVLRSQTVYGLGASLRIPAHGWSKFFAEVGMGQESADVRDAICYGAANLHPPLRVCDLIG